MSIGRTVRILPTKLHNPELDGSSIFRFPFDHDLELQRDLSNLKAKILISCGQNRLTKGALKVNFPFSAQCPINA